MMAHQVRFAEDIGFASMTAASVFALSGILLSMGQASGFLSDRLGREWTLTLAATFSIISIVILLLVRETSQLWMLYVHAIFFGYGAGLALPVHASGVADLFHGRHFGAIYGLSLTGMGVGGAIGPWLGGHIFDVAGSYASAFMACIAAFSVACLLFWLAAPRNARRWRAGN